MLQKKKQFLREDAMREPMRYREYRLMKGGPGSGHFGHEGRPGQVGGSLPSDESPDDQSTGEMSLAKRLGHISAKTAVDTAGSLAGTVAGWQAGKALGPKAIDRLSQALSVSRPRLAKLIALSNRIPMLKDIIAYAFATAGSGAGATIGGPLLRSLYDYLVEDRKITESISQEELEDLDLSDMPGLPLVVEIEKGGPGSGHFGHEGRPGQVGGSLPSDESRDAVSPPKPDPKQVAKDLASLTASAAGSMAGYKIGAELDHTFKEMAARGVAKVSPKTASFFISALTKVPLLAKAMKLVPGPWGLVLSLAGGTIADFAVSALIDYLSDEGPADELTDEQAAALQQRIYERMGYTPEELAQLERDLEDEFGHDLVREAVTTTDARKALDAIADSLQDEDGPIPTVIAPAITDKIFEALEDLPEDERQLVIPLMAALGEANVESLAEEGKLLPQDADGYPILPQSIQESLGLSDEQVRRLTPIAMTIAMLGGLYTAWPNYAALLKK